MYKIIKMKTYLRLKLIKFNELIIQQPKKIDLSLIILVMFYHLTFYFPYFTVKIAI